MIKLFHEIRRALDGARLFQNTDKLRRIELGQCFRHHREAAKFTEEMMKEAGLARVERIAFPADGKTCFEDKTSPLAWDATVGRLTVIRSPEKFEEPVVADYQRRPFHLVKGSVATPPGGVVARLITEEQLLGGCDAAGAMVMLNPETRAWSMYSTVCDLGALGMVTDCLTGRYETPDAVGWINGFSEGSHWHVVDDDRPIIAFSVTPRSGDALRAAARSGEVLVRVESDGRRYAGEVDVVTGVLPGREAREVWALGHLYEPLSDDNSSGVVAGIEIARALRKMIAEGSLPQPRFTLRLVFGLEMYGFAAYVERRGGRLRDEVIGADNLDGLPIAKDCPPVRLHAAPPGTPFFGNYFLEEMFERYQGQTQPALGQFVEMGMYGDDTCFSNPTNGVPTIWIIGKTHRLWHNSAQDMSIVDGLAFERCAALHGAYLAKLLLFDGAEAETEIAAAGVRTRARLLRESRLALEEACAHPAGSTEEALGRARRRLERRLAYELGQFADFRRVSDSPRIEQTLRLLPGEMEGVWQRLEEQLKDLAGRRPASDVAAAQARPWLDYAATILPARATVGFPYDLRRVPKAERRKLPDACIYGPLARVLANMDGRRTLRDLLEEAEWETGTRLREADVQQLTRAVSFLGDWGYLSVRYGSEVTREQLVGALRQAGVKSGDLLLAHTGLSHFGRVQGGAETLVEALLEAVGQEGTLLLPAFTSPFARFVGSAATNRRFRPHEADRAELITTGRAPQVLMGRPGAIRSRHCSHSVVGVGPLASECLESHKVDDPPTGRSSPFGKLLEHGGKMAWVGASLGATTFFHFLETELDLPCLAGALCCVKENGQTRTLFVPKHLPGHRDFYGDRNEDSKAYRRLLAMGLKIGRAKVGLGGVKVIEARQMYDLGAQALRQEPDLFLCDAKECSFCGRHRRG